jgi:hypothetical protein
VKLVFGGVSKPGKGFFFLMKTVGAVLPSTGLVLHSQEPRSLFSPAQRRNYCLLEKKTAEEENIFTERPPSTWLLPRSKEKLLPT